MILHPPHFAEGFMSKILSPSTTWHFNTKGMPWPHSLGVYSPSDERKTDTHSQISDIKLMHFQTHPQYSDEPSWVRYCCGTQEFVVQTRDKQIPLAQLYHWHRSVLDQQGTKSSW